jgi:hypothetical protein
MLSNIRCLIWTFGFACFLAASGCSSRSAGTLPSSNRSGYLLFYAKSTSGDRYFFFLPERFSYSKSSGSHFFTSTTGESLEVSFSSTRSAGMEQLDSATFGGTGSAHKRLRKDGSVGVWRVEPGGTHSSYKWTGYALWTDGKADGAITLKSSRPKQSVEKELSELCVAFYFSGSEGLDADVLRRLQVVRISP